MVCLLLVLRPATTGLWLAGNEGREKKMETTIVCYEEAAVRIVFLHSWLTKCQTMSTVGIAFH